MRKKFHKNPFICHIFLVFYDENKRRIINFTKRKRSLLNLGQLSPRFECAFAIIIKEV